MLSIVDSAMGRTEEAELHSEESVAILEPLNARHELASAYSARALFYRLDRSHEPEKAKQDSSFAMDHDTPLSLPGCLSGFFTLIELTN